MCVCVCACVCVRVRLREVERRQGRESASRAGREGIKHKVGRVGGRAAGPGKAGQDKANARGEGADAPMS